MKDLTTIKRPKKIHDRDVYSIRTETGQELAASLLSQAEYNYVVKYAKKKHPTNTKLSRKEHPLSYSVVFDEKGQPFVLYRGKSVAAQVKQNLFPPEQVPTLMSRWDFGQEKLLGEGSFGRVKISQNMHTGQWGAVKIILTERPDIDPSVLDFNIQRERFFLSKYKRMWGYAARTGATRKRYLFQSLIEGEQLWDWVARDVPSQRIWPECDQMRLNIAEKTTAALEECHKKAILHRDVKLENFLVDPHTQEVALIDFGLSRTSEQGLSLESSSLVGTKAYQAPELAK